MNRRNLNCLKLDKEYYTRRIAECEQHKAFLIEYMKTMSETTVNKINAQIDKYKGKIESIETQLKAFNEKLHAIEDPELKEMAIAYYIEWQSCEEIGRKYYLDRTTVYKKLMCYFGE